MQQSAGAGVLAKRGMDSRMPVMINVFMVSPRGLAHSHLMLPLEVYDSRYEGYSGDASRWASVLA